MHGFYIRVGIFLYNTRARESSIFARDMSSEFDECVMFIQYVEKKRIVARVYIGFLFYFCFNICEGKFVFQINTRKNILFVFRICSFICLLHSKFTYSKRANIGNDSQYKY